MLQTLAIAAPGAAGGALVRLPTPALLGPLVVARLLVVLVTGPLVAKLIARYA
ncbi:MAG: hypothetical protein NVSMB64_05950 [Candidatus Velthaea sp.]